MDGTTFYGELSTDGLAEELLALKQKAGDLRQLIWKIEDELRNRMLASEASVLLGEEYCARLSVKREVTWDQVALAQAESVAFDGGVGPMFRKAFPVKYDCSVRNLNALMKLGGATAKAIEAAKVETKEKLEVKVEGLK